MDEPIRPHQSAVMVTVQLGTAASILVDVLGHEVEYPSLAIVHDGLTVTIEPHGPSEGGLVTECDVLRGKELAEAAEVYYQRLERQLECQRLAAMEREHAMTTVTREAEPPVAGIAAFLDAEETR